jgi:hypothetical protein
MSEVPLVFYVGLCPQQRGTSWKVRAEECYRGDSNLRTRTAPRVVLCS